MIQRKQSLFLFQLVFLGIALLFIPVQTVVTNSASTEVYLVPLEHPGLTSTAGHMAAVALNFIALILTFITIFLYKKRELQLKLCYVLIVMWLVIGLMTVFCPFVEATAIVISATGNYLGAVTALAAMVGAYMAIRHIKKDIALLKSADRIR